MDERRQGFHDVGRTPFVPREDAAAHIAEMTCELAELARRHPHLDILAYLLDIARLEAVAQAERPSWRSAGS